MVKSIACSALWARADLGVIGDAFAALKGVLLMHERLDGLKGDVMQVADDVRALAEKVYDLNTRLTRLETALAVYERTTARPRLEP